MAKRGVLFVVFLLVFCLGTLSGAILSISPMASGTFGLVTGYDLSSMADRERTAYTSGVIDTMYAVLVEVGVLLDADQYKKDSIRANRDANDAAVKKVMTLAYLVGESNPTAQQLIDVVKRYIDDHPSKRHESAALLVWRAFAEINWK